jgi:hypothetical protein
LPENIIKSAKEHFIGLAGSAAATGIAIATFEMNAIFILGPML